MMNVPIARTGLTEGEVQSVLEPLRSGWLVQGPKVREFEEKWSVSTGARHSINETTGTTGFHLSLVVLGFGLCTEASLPALTWVTKTNPSKHYN